MLEIGEKLPSFTAHLVWNGKMALSCPRKGDETMTEQNIEGTCLLVTITNPEQESWGINSFYNAIKSEEIQIPVYFLINLNQLTSTERAADNYPLKPFSLSVWGIYTPEAKKFNKDVRYNGNSLESVAYLVKDGIVQDLWGYPQYQYINEDYPITLGEQPFMGLDGHKIAQEIQKQNQQPRTVKTVVSDLTSSTLTNSVDLTSTPIQ